MEENKDILNGGLEPLSEADVKDVKVENARTRPNSTGLYGSASLKQEDVKKIFDAYPNKLREKLNDVIAFANALLGVLGNGVDGATITGALNSLSERVGGDGFDEDSRLEGKALASAILKLSEDLKAEEDKGEDRDERISKFESDRGVTKVDYDDKNEVITFTFADGKTKEIDLPLESLVKGARLEGDALVLTLENGNEIPVSTAAIAAAIIENTGYITSVNGTVIPADSVHCRREADGIYLTDNSGKTVVIPLLQLWTTATDFDTFGLVRINRAGNGGLALNGGYLVTNPANETELNVKKDDRKPVVSKNFAAGLNANLKAGEGIALSYDETAKEVTVSATGGGSGSGTTVKVNGEVVAEFDADTKLDKNTSTSSYARAYVVNKDGSQGVLEVSNDYTNRAKPNHLVQRSSEGGNIYLPSVIGNNNTYAVHKQYVDNKIISLGVPSFTTVFWEGSLSKGTVGGENQYILFPMRFTYTASTEWVMDWKATVQTTMTYQMGSAGEGGNIPLPLISLGDSIYRIKASFSFYADYYGDGNYTPYSDVTFNCQKLNGSTWEDTTDIAVTKIEY